MTFVVRIDYFLINFSFPFPLSFCLQYLLIPLSCAFTLLLDDSFSFPSRLVLSTIPGPSFLPDDTIGLSSPGHAYSIITSTSRVVLPAFPPGCP